MSSRAAQTARNLTTVRSMCLRQHPGRLFDRRCRAQANRPSIARSLAVCAARDDQQWLLGLFIRNGEQMHMERNALACSQRVFAIGENFHAAKKPREQTAQAGPGEEILVIALE
jgi:hypothetical protein